MFSQPAGRPAAWLSLFVGCGFSNAANITLAFANRGVGLSIDAVVSVWFILSLTMYGVAFILYSRSLSRIPLSVAYPIFVGASLILVSLASYVWLDYPMSLLQMFGLMLVFLGVTLVSSASDTPSPRSETAP